MFSPVENEEFCPAEEREPFHFKMGSKDRYKNRKEGLLKVFIFTLLFNNSCQSHLSSHSYDSLHPGIQILSNL